MSPEKRKKGLGYFGKLKRPDGKYSTELSIGITGQEFDWKETEVPLLVPGLTRDEINYLLAGNEATEEIVEKAKRHALIRIWNKKEPFAQFGEQQEPDEFTHPNLSERSVAQEEWQINQRKIAIEQMKKEEGIMPYNEKKTFDEVEKVSEGYTMEQWAADKPVKKLDESKKDFGKRHRTWLKRKPKI